MFASNSDRLALVNSVSSFNACRFAVRFSKNGRDSELHFSDGEFENAFDTAHAWKHVHGAEYVEMFRVDEKDGSLYGGIGAL